MDIDFALITNYPITFNLYIDGYQASGYAQGDMMKTAIVIVGDSRFDLNFSLLQLDRITPVDLTNASVVLYMADRTDVSTILFTGTCTVSSTLNGLCYYTSEPTDFDTVGMYEGKLVATYTNGKVITAKKINVNVVNGI
jgi:hypothetical protein